MLSCFGILVFDPSSLPCGFLAFLCYPISHYGKVSPESYTTHVKSIRAKENAQTVFFRFGRFIVFHAVSMYLLYIAFNRLYIVVTFKRVFAAVSLFVYPARASCSIATSIGSPQEVKRLSHVSIIARLSVARLSGNTDILYIVLLPSREFVNFRVFPI